MIWNLQHIIFIWRQRYWQIFKSTLVHLETNFFVKCVMEWSWNLGGESLVSVDCLAGLPSSVNDQIAFTGTFNSFDGRGGESLPWMNNYEGCIKFKTHISFAKMIELLKNDFMNFLKCFFFIYIYIVILFFYNFFISWVHLHCRPLACAFYCCCILNVSFNINNHWRNFFGSSNPYLVWVGNIAKFFRNLSGY